jgi:hypothetical protein
MADDDDDDGDDHAVGFERSSGFDTVSFDSQAAQAAVLPLVLPDKKEE